MFDQPGEKSQKAGFKSSVLNHPREKLQLRALNINVHHETSPLIAISTDRPFRVKKKTVFFKERSGPILEINM